MGAAENEKLMRDLFAGIAAGNRTALADHLADDLVMRVTGQYSWSRTFNGKQAFLRDLHGTLATLVADGRRTIPLNFVAGGDHVVVEARGEMQTKAGVPTTTNIVWSIASRTARSSRCGNIAIPC